MVKIRLRRRGRKQYPVYDIVATDGRRRRGGEYLEKLGQYNPNNNPSSITLNHERALYWLQCGAQPTIVARKILSMKGVLLNVFLLHKGKTAEEIKTALEKHEAVVASRATRKEVKRQQRKSAKVLAKEAADAAAKAAAQSAE